ncbi:hypothetical protein FVE85_4047 [Porphyridium purpureum]|uniref:Uncharacterized protein n=1 Tax=Porphyridium purpureum TaxID=35688 RepID=A0A5J4YTB4_PORPP|nr:hypothetical protein FVE85_4047 [Porphyridium purpureum]|eukprot:POR9473..scf229_5
MVGRYQSRAVIDASRGREIYGLEFEWTTHANEQNDSWASRVPGGSGLVVTRLAVQGARAEAWMDRIARCASVLYELWRSLVHFVLGVPYEMVGSDGVALERIQTPRPLSLEQQFPGSFGAQKESNRALFNVNRETTLPSESLPSMASTSTSTSGVSRLSSMLRGDWITSLTVSRLKATSASDSATPSRAHHGASGLLEPPERPGVSARMFRLVLEGVEAGDEPLVSLVDAMANLNEQLPFLLSSRLFAVLTNPASVATLVSIVSESAPSAVIVNSDDVKQEQEEDDRNSARVASISRVVALGPPAIRLLITRNQLLLSSVFSALTQGVHATKGYEDANEPSHKALCHRARLCEMLIALCKEDFKPISQHLVRHHDILASLVLHIHEPTVLDFLEQLALSISALEVAGARVRTEKEFEQSLLLFSQVRVYDLLADTFAAAATTRESAIPLRTLRMRMAMENAVQFFASIVQMTGGLLVKHKHRRPVWYLNIYENATAVGSILRVGSDHSYQAQYAADGMADVEVLALAASLCKKCLDYAYMVSAAQCSISAFEAELSRAIPRVLECLAASTKLHLAQLGRSRLALVEFIASCLQNGSTRTRASILDHGAAAILLDLCEIFPMNSVLHRVTERAVESVLILCNPEGAEEESVVSIRRRLLKDGDVTRRILRAWDRYGAEWESNGAGNTFLSHCIQLACCVHFTVSRIRNRGESHTPGIELEQWTEFEELWETHLLRILNEESLPLGGSRPQRSMMHALQLMDGYPQYERVESSGDGSPKFGAVSQSRSRTALLLPNSNRATVVRAGIYEDEQANDHPFLSRLGYWTGRDTFGSKRSWIGEEDTPSTKEMVEPVMQPRAGLGLNPKEEEDAKRTLAAIRY